MVNLNAKQFQKQNILRTVTVGFQPYLPFSQQYSMKYLSRGPGYFDLTPQPNNRQDSTTGKGNSYLFEDRMKTFMGQGEGYLADMSRFYQPSRAEKSVNAASNIGAGAQTNLRSEQLAKIFTSKVGLTAAGGDMGELATQGLTKKLDDELNIKQKPIAYDGKIDRGIKRGGKFWGSDFDQKLETTSQTWRDFLESKVGAETMRRVHSLEQTSSRKKTLGMSAKDMREAKGKTPTEKFRNHLNDRFKLYNQRIKEGIKGMTSIQKEEVTRMKGKTGSNTLATRGLFHTPKYFKDSKTGRVVAGMEFEAMLHRDIREFLSRTARSEAIDAAHKGTAPSQYLYQVKVPKGIGLAVISSEVSKGKVNGMHYPILKVAGVPVINLESGTDINHAYGQYMVTERGVDALKMQDYIKEAEIYGSNLAILTEDRLAHKEHVATISAAAMVHDNIGMNVGDSVLSNVRLTPFDIAENLRKQIYNHFNKGNVKKKFGEWYRGIMEDSNRLTKTWVNAVPSSTYRKGKKFSEEWTFGDDKGNPNKRYLGVWSEQAQNTWKNDVGRNVSISPFVISRRKGVAAFRTGGDYGNS